jgi:hypothetical protein
MVKARTFVTSPEEAGREVVPPAAAFSTFQLRIPRPTVDKIGVKPYDKAKEKRVYLTTWQDFLSPAKTVHEPYLDMHGLSSARPEGNKP